MQLLRLVAGLLRLLWHAGLSLGARCVRGSTAVSGRCTVLLGLLGLEVLGVGRGG